MECVRQTIHSSELNHLIDLPLSLRDREVEVTVLAIDHTDIVGSGTRKRDLLSPVTIDTGEWKWNREEANERR